MSGQIAYEVYREALASRTRNWHELKREEAHAQKTDQDFDQWLRENKPEELNRYFMGDYDAMPAHTKAGWEAFATHAGKGVESAWNNYADKACSNFHRERGIILPRYDELADSQKEAISRAVSVCCSVSASARP